MCDILPRRIHTVGSERRTCFERECVMALQGHPRSLILAPIECAYSYWSSILTLVLSCPISEILQVSWENDPIPIPSVVWNSLPPHLRSPSISQFRAGLKTHLFKEAYTGNLSELFLKSDFNWTETELTETIYLICTSKISPLDISSNFWGVMGSSVIILLQIYCQGWQ